MVSNEKLNKVKGKKKKREYLNKKKKKNTFTLENLKKTYLFK